jgi:hypothetical protein
MKTKNLILCLAAILCGVSMFAQGVEIKGNLSELKGVSKIKTVFDYSGIIVGVMNEDEYVDKKVKEKDAETPGSGEIWKRKWISDRATNYEPKFEELFRKYMRGVLVGKEVESEVVMNVHTTFLEPGVYTMTWGSRPAMIDLTVTFTKNNTELAVVKISQSPGNGGGFDAAARIGEAYAKAGKELGARALKATK